MSRYVYVYHRIVLNCIHITIAHLLFHLCHSMITDNHPHFCINTSIIIIIIIIILFSENIFFWIKTKWKFQSKLFHICIDRKKLGHGTNNTFLPNFISIHNDSIFPVRPHCTVVLSFFNSVHFCKHSIIEHRPLSIRRSYSFRVHRLRLRSQWLHLLLLNTLLAKSNARIDCRLQIIT